MSLTGMAAPADPSLEDVLRRLLERSSGSVVVTKETVSGRIIIREDQGSAGSDVFREQRFELVEECERLDLGTEARIYEEICLHRTRTTRLHIVSELLRREQAEVTIDGVGEPPPAPVSDTTPMTGPILRTSFNSN